jgi:hypothetical protein
MARLVGTFMHSHGGTTSLPGELWTKRRGDRPIREDVPFESDEVNIAKAARTHEGFRVLREKIAELEPDVLVVFSDDQLECFDFNNYPAFAVYVGEEFKKRPARDMDRGPQMGRHADPGSSFPGHKDLAVAVLTGIMKRGFDPAFCMDMPKPDRGIAAGIIRTAEELTDFPNMPIVPIMMNLYFAPQPSGYRCYQLGKAVREVIDEYPSNIKVGIVASGGLWHTPGRTGAWLNTEWDRHMLELLGKGDAKGMAEYLDNYEIPEGDTSQDISVRSRNVTGMPSSPGPVLGTRETCAWISAAAASEGLPHTIIDYVDAFASPVGNAFAYCDDI